jgi:GTP-binding protein
VPVVLVANKAEGKGRGSRACYEAYSLGFGDPVPFSAEHGEGMGDLFEALLPLLEGAEEEGRTRRRARRGRRGGAQPRPLKLAIVGRPNAGKSTLINRCWARTGC